MISCHRGEGASFSAMLRLVFVVGIAVFDVVDSFAIVGSSITTVKTASTKFSLASRRQMINPYDDRDASTRETEIGRMSEGLARTGMKDMNSLEVGDIVVAKYEIANLNIWGDSGYEIIEMYAQGVDKETGQIDKIALTSLADNTAQSKVGYTKYLKVYSPKYHSDSGPVIVTPDEMGLITIKDELVESLWLALPGLFWVVLAATFASNYNERYGGDFFNAMFRT